MNARNRLVLQFAFERFREDAGLPPEVPVFQDRSMIDLYAYAKRYSPDQSYMLQVPARESAACISAAFILDREMTNIKSDWLRKDSAEQAKAIAQDVLTTYQEMGVTVVKLLNNEPREVAELIIRRKDRKEGQN
jgi:predicted ATPase